MKFNKGFIALLVIAAVMSTAAVRAQSTNQFYNVGDMDVMIAPTLSVPSIALAQRNQAYGLTLNMDYWQTARTATGIEIGTRDMRNVSNGEIDHITAIEKIRLVPFVNTPILNRLALTGYTGAEQWLDDGSKGLILGAGFEYAFTPNLRFAIDVAHQFETNPAKTADRLRAGLQLRF